MPDEHPGVLPYLVFSWRCQMLHPTQGSDKSPWIKEQSGNSLPSPASSPISSLPSHCSPSLIRLWPHYPSLYPSNPSGPPHPSARVILRCLTAAFFLLVLFLFLLLLCLSSSSSSPPCALLLPPLTLTYLQISYVYRLLHNHI